jgi:ketosteroid isomerase-like protein
MFGGSVNAAVTSAAKSYPALEIAKDRSDAVAHLDAVRRGWAAFNNRDFEGAVQYLHQDGEAFPVAGLQDPGWSGGTGGLRGREEVRRFLERVGDAWQRVRVEPREATMGPDDRLLVVEGWHIDDPGIELQTMVITVYAFRDGLVARLEAFIDRSRALEALGAPRVPSVAWP